MQATLNVITNPFHPQLDRIQKPIQRKVKVNTLVHKHKIDLSKPVICYYNSTPILRKQWGTTTVKDGDVVTFVYLPQGGGGSNPLKLALMLAVSIYAPALAGSILGTTSGLAFQVLSAGIGMLGNMLINALIPPPQPPKGQQASQMAAASPTYSIGAQGNQARLGQPIPVIYGKMKTYPDFAAQPYAEFESNEQYLYQLFTISQGAVSVNISDVFVEDSPINAFAEAQLEVIPPGGVSTLFPRNVYNVSEVSGQELSNLAVGPFVVNPALTEVTTLAFDLVAPKGLFYLDDEGNMLTKSVTANCYAQMVDDVGANIGAPILLGQRSFSGATATAIRRTYKFNVTSGRYKVYATRVDAKDTSTRAGHDLVWASARGYSVATTSYGDVTMIAVKIRATNNISSQSSRKINLIARRQLPIPTYNAVTGAYDWSAPVVTDSIAWAIADMCRAAYGAGVTEARFDVSQLLALDALWTSRGDKLNCVFDSSQTFWEALTMVCRAGRVRPYVQGGMIHFVRDQLETLPTAMFTGRNIIKGSFKITYVMPSEDTADAVDVEYFDETLWKPRIIRAQLDEGSATKPAKVKAFGITSRAQAYREGMYIAASNRYRRKEITFDTELEGHVPSLGDLIGIQSDIPEWGQHGEVVGVQLNGLSSVITSSEPLTWTPAAAHYMMLRRPNGSAAGPIEVTQGANEFEIVFDQSLVDFDIYAGHEKEKTYISFGRSGAVIQLARVLSTKPRGNTVQISAINEDARVHSADGTVVPTDVYEWSLVTPKVKPILGDFLMTQTGSGATPSIALSWAPTPGASRYIIEKSTDNENWETVGEVTMTSFSFLANTGTLYVRVAAFGGVIGPYVTKTLTVGAVPPPANVTAGAISVNGQSYDVSWAPVTDCDGYSVEVLAGGPLSVKRSFNTSATTFAYTVENAIADGGPWRSIQVKVKARKGGVLSEVALTLNGTNAAPVAPTLTLVPGAGNVSVTISKCEELDYAGTLVYASSAPGFTPGPANLIYEGLGTFFLHPTTVQKYFVAAHYDSYGKVGLSYSAETSATPLTNSSGIETVSVLPSPATSYEGQVVYLTTDDLLYTFDFETQTWSPAGKVPDGSITYAKLDPGLAFSVEVEPGEINEVHIASDSISTPKLQANSIVAAKIAANAITTEKIEANAVVADKIAANSISSEKIIAGSIQSDRLTIGNFSNLCENNGFELGDNGSWLKGAGWAVVEDAANAYSGTKIATRAASPTSSALSNVKFACTPGQEYKAQAFIKCSADIVGGAYVQVTAFDNSDVPTVLAPVGNTVSALAYTMSEAIVDVPVGAVKIRVDMVATNTAGTVYADQAVLTLNTQTTIEDGTITTNMIAAGAVNASKINVASLSAINANMGNLTSGTITLDNAGHIKGGMTDYNTGAGFWMGYKDATYKFSIGNGTNSLTWDGAALNIKGNLIAGSIQLGTGFSASSSGAITIKSGTSGERVEIYNDVIKVFDSTGTLRVKLGNLA